MTTFTINQSNEIVAFSTPEQASAATETPFDSFSSEAEMAELAAAWPAERLVAIWNSLPGVAPVKKFKNAKLAVGMIWTRLKTLGEMVAPAQPEAAKPKAAPKAEEPPAKAKPAVKAKGGAPAPKVAPTKGKASKKATPAKPAPKAKKGAKAQETAADAGEPRGGSKMADVIWMMQRKDGVTITEIMSSMKWQRHTVRGFVAGALKKAGYTVESFKPEGGERSYRISK